MRLAFFGSPDFAVPALRGLAEAGHDLAAAYCQPPRSFGRGRQARACPVEAAARALGVPVRHPVRLRGEPAEWESFHALEVEAAVVAAYGLILPPAMLDAPDLGCLNVHASLLPRWRGAAPIQAAILAGDGQTGVTIMRMEAGLDTGPVLLAQAVPITEETTLPGLRDRLALLGRDLALRALAERPAASPQPMEGVTYAPKLSRADAVIDWTAPAAAIGRRVRALNPWPGTETRLEGVVLKVHAALPTDGAGIAGEVLDGRLTVACGSGALRLTTVQVPGRSAMPAADFLRGWPVPAGTRLG